MLSVLFVGLAILAAPQTSPVSTTAAPTPAMPTTDFTAPSIPADIENDVVCMIALTELDRAYSKLPADKQMSMADSRSQIRGALHFYIGAVSARRTDSEIVSAIHKPAVWLTSQPAIDQVNLTKSCLTAMWLRFKTAASALGQAR